MIDIFIRFIQTNSTGDCSQYDGEPLTLAHEEDDTLFDDIADAISSL